MEQNLQNTPNLSEISEVIKDLRSEFLENGERSFGIMYPRKIELLDKLFKLV